MRSALTQILFTTFPDLHREDIASSCSGPGIGDGWYQLYLHLCTDLTAIIDLKDLDPSEFFFVQVKEKFGLLRVYMSSETDDMRIAIQKAEEESERTCETCGMEGTLRHDGWMKVRCDECQRERVRNRANEVAIGRRRDSGVFVG